MNLKWNCFSFKELTPEQLYSILRLRSEVFVVEQNCVFLDMDDKDQNCFHLCGWNEKDLVAYVRLVPPGIAFPEMSIGRVVTSPKYRRFGAGKMLMKEAIDQCYLLFNKNPIRIGAQVYLKKFYEFFGFVAEGEIYLEDDIEHIEMILMRMLNLEIIHN